MKLDAQSKIKGDLGGVGSITFKPGNSFNDFCSKNIRDYNPDRFEAFALRVFYGKETAITLYAIDKDRMEGDNYNKEKMPVKKFKLNILFLQSLPQLIEECNFTLSTSDYDLEDIEVINK